MFSISNDELKNKPVLGKTIITENVCKWDSEDIESKGVEMSYETECGNNFTTNPETHKEDKFIYCPFCGQEIITKRKQ